MSGSRLRSGRPRHSVTRNEIWRARIAAAETTEAFYDAAADWLRASCHRRARQDAGAKAKAQNVLYDAAAYLSNLANEMDRAVIAATDPQRPE